jgi:chromate transporter
LTEDEATPPTPAAAGCGEGASSGSVAEPTLGEALRTWSRVALQSFGGPAGQIAVMHRILVEEKRWVSEERFLHALSYCMMLPGPEAQQLATYIGWLLHRTLGGLVAGVLFVLPGFVAILGLSFLYVGFGDVALVEGLFFGIKPAVLALVVQALLRIGRRALGHPANVSIAVGAFVAIFFFDVSFPWIVLAAGLLGLAGAQVIPTAFAAPAAQSVGRNASVVDALLDRQTPGHTRPTWGRALRVATVCLVLWWTPVLAIAALAGWDDVFTRIGLFFSKLAVVTFGGAYAVLAYMAQQAVETYGWLAPGEMLDGLGMAETTPGPLIQVVQFVGFLAAYRDPGALDAWLAGTLAAVLTTWVTFVPCFLWIFLGAPYIESLRGSWVARGALAGITAAVVGVVLNLAIWFSLHTLFASLSEGRIGPLLLRVPEWASIDPVAAGIALVAVIAALRFHVGMLPLIGGCALAGMVWQVASAGG